MAITPLFIGGIKNDADGINDAAQNQPAKTSPTQCVDEWSGRNHCQPAHGNIDQQRQYAPTFGQPDFLSNAKQCQPPDYAKQSPTPGAAQADQAKWSIAARYQQINGAMIELAPDALGEYSQAVIARREIGRAHV